MTKLWSGNFNELSKDIDREGHAEYWLQGGTSARARQRRGLSASTPAKPDGCAARNLQPVRGGTE